MATKAERPKRGELGFDKGSREGRNEKPSAPKCSEGLRKSSGKLEKLFSSFLRGASCPKSPRVAATAASIFMPEPAADVKGRRQKGGNHRLHISEGAKIRATRSKREEK